MSDRRPAPVSASHCRITRPRGYASDLSSLHAAFEGAHDLLFVSSPEFDLDTRMGQHERVIEGARRARVRHIAYTSFLGAQSEQPGGLNAHYLTERALERSGMMATFLRHPFYTGTLGLAVRPDRRGTLRAIDFRSRTAHRTPGDLDRRLRRWARQDDAAGGLRTASIRAP